MVTFVGFGTDDYMCWPMQHVFAGRDNSFKFGARRNVLIPNVPVKI